MIEECLMTEDCPGYDRDRRECLLRPEDCEFAPASVEATRIGETPEAPAAPPPDLDRPRRRDQDGRQRSV